MNFQPSTPINALLEAVWDTGELGDLNSTLQHLTDVARRRFKADSWASFALNHITGEFVPSVALARENGRELNSMVLSGLRQSDFLEPLLQKRVLLVEDLAAAPQYQDNFASLNRVQSFIAVSLLTRQLRKPLALLYLNFHQPRRFSEDDQKWLRLFADQASSVLQNSWLLHRFREITHVGQAINQEFGSIAALFKKLQKQVGPILDISHFFMLAIYQSQAEKFDLFLSESGQYRSLLQNPLNGGYEWVLREQTPLLIGQLSAETERLPAPLENIPGTDPTDRESLIFVPLALEGVPLGLLSIQHPAPDIYTTNDLHILSLLGNYVTSALNNRRIFANLRQLNDTGHILTQKLGSEEVLQNVVDQLRDTTKADLVILYPYKETSRQFDFPPYVSGDLRQAQPPQPSASRASDIAALVLHHPEPVFAEDSLSLYRMLGGSGQQKSSRFAEREEIRSIAALSLRVIDEAVGVLFLNFRQRQIFDRPTQQVIQGLANYAAIAIKHAREFGSLAHRHIQELEILQKIDRQISQSLELQTVLQTILQLANDHIAPDKGAILLYDPRTASLIKEAATGRDADKTLDRSIPLDQEKGITRWVFQSKKSVRVGNVRQDPNWREMYLAVSSGILSELDVPLLDGDEVIGIINLESIRENAFDEADQQFLETLAGQAVIAVKNAQVYEKQKRLLKERQALNQISREIISQLVGANIFETILAKALEMTKSDTGTLMLYDPQAKDLRLAAGRGVTTEQEKRRHKLEEGVTGWVAQNRQPVNIGDISQPPWNVIHLPFIPNVRSELAVPLLEGDKLRGVLNIESPHLNHFDQDTEQLLIEFADLAVIALQNTERYQKVIEGQAKLEALREVDQKIIRQLGDVDQVMQAILENASILTGAEHVGLFLYEGNEASRVYRARIDMAAAERTIERFEALQVPGFVFNRGIVNRVAQIKKAYLTRGDAQADPYYAGKSDIHSEVAVPLLSKETLVGVLNMESPRHYAFDEATSQLLEIFAGQAVIAIQNTRSYNQAQRRSRRLQLLYRAAQELGELTDLDQIDDAFEIVTGIAQEHSTSEVVIRRYNPDTQELVLVRTARWENPPPLSRIHRDDPYISPWVARTGETLVIPNIDEPPSKVAGIKPADPKTKSVINAPIKIKGEFLGNLAVTHHRANHFELDSEDVILIEGLANQLAITIQRLEITHAQQEAEKRAKEAEVMGAMSSQAFELAHRLGNDLGLISSYVNNIKRDLSAEGVTNTAIEENLRKIVRDVRRVLLLSTRLKQELREFRSGRRPTDEQVPLSPQLLFEEAAQSLASLPSNIQIHYDIPQNIADVNVSLNQVTDILHNLLTNALDSMPAGGIITLRARNARAYVALEIEDTGIGIAADQQDRIFDFLYSTKVSGSGFGLWSARRKALESGGDLRLKDSQSGQGTIFVLHLPRASSSGRSQ